MGRRMLKVFVPQYDGPTKDNARLANFAFPNTPSYLVLGNKATRQSLHKHIQVKSTTALLLMAHGCPECVYAQADEVALSIPDVIQDTGGVLRLKIFAWACKTSLKLGPAFQANTTSTGAWWGYRTTISAPCPTRLNAFREVIHFIAGKFHTVKTYGDAKIFFKGLHALCEAHRSEVVTRMAVSGDLRDAHEIAVALREIWQHLDALLPGMQQPFHADMVCDSMVEGV